MLWIGLKHLLRTWPRSAWGVKRWDLCHCQQCRFIKPTYEDENRSKEKLKVNNLNGMNKCKLSLRERERGRDKERGHWGVLRWFWHFSFFIYIYSQAPKVVTFWFSAKSNNLIMALQRAYKLSTLKMSFRETKGFVLFVFFSLNPQLEACIVNVRHILSTKPQV